MKPICTINTDGDKFWYLNDKLHREDGPAIECASGTKAWYLNGKCHREDGPAYESANGNKYWYRDALLHREDGPAIEYAGGSKMWYYQGKFIDCKDNQEFLRIVKLMVFL